MRIVGLENPSLPPLDPLPPSETSWALQVESEEASHLRVNEKLSHTDRTTYCGYHGKVSRGSSEWAGSGSREFSHGSRHAKTETNFKLSKSSNQASYTNLSTRRTYATKSCDELWKQPTSLTQHTRRQAYSPAQRKYCDHEKSRSSDFSEARRQNKNKISPSRSHRFHQYGQSQECIGDKVSETANRSCHPSSQPSSYPPSRQSHRDRHQGTQAARFFDNSKFDKHGRVLVVQQSVEKGDLKRGSPRGTQDLELEDNARFLKPSQPAGYEKKCHNRSSDDEGFRGSRGIVYNDRKNKRKDGLTRRVTSHLLNCKQSKDEGCIQAGSRIDKYVPKKVTESREDSTLMNYKCTGNDNNGYRTCLDSNPASKIRTKLSSSSEEAGTLLIKQDLCKRMGDEGTQISLLQAEEGIGRTFTEGQRGTVQETGSLFDIMLESSNRDDAEAKESDRSDAEQQYDMLASLLLDDLLDIGQEFDVGFASEGPDLGFCGSIFDDGFEIPVSMDVEDVAHVLAKKEPMPDSQLAGLHNPHLCAVGGLFQDGENIIKHPSMSTNKHAKEAHALRDRPAEKQQPSKRSLEMKPSPRVFVDVTNKFEIHAPPVTKDIQENDSHRLNQRQKQVEFGKNTLGYERYSEFVPRCKRKPQDPQTPNPKQICSKRSWDGQIRKWRRLLHVYDLPNVDGEEKAEDFSILKFRQGHAAASKQDDTMIPKSIEIKGCKKIKADASLSIYDDWIVL